MKRRVSIVVLLEIALGFNLACQPVSSQYESSETFANKPVIANQQNIESNASVEDLCNRLSELKRMPYKDKVAGDEIYDGLINKGNDAIPCLIGKITDLTVMEDPRESPHILDFRVGDAAVFMLHEITEEPLESILPRKEAKLWETEGVYAYFAYVEKPQNRKKVQIWWRRRANQTQSVPSK